MIRLALISFFAFTVLLGFNSAQMKRPTPSPRTNHFSCELDIALTANDASASIVSGTTREAEPAKPSRSGPSVSTKPEFHSANLIGRGVANCKNQQGFQFNMPAILAIAINSTDAIPLQEIRATLPPISVDRDVNRIFDQYNPHIVLENTPTTSRNAASERSVVVKGERNHVLLQVNLNLPSDFNSKVKISRVDLRFDNEAPNLGTE